MAYNGTYELQVSVLAASSCNQSLDAAANAAAVVAVTSFDFD